jgi:hypothetical protein
VIELTAPGRELDALVGEKVMGYRWDKVAPDYDGQNAGKVLVPPTHREGYTYPPRGPIHHAFHCRHWSTRLEDVMEVALRCHARGWTVCIERLAGDVYWEAQIGPGRTCSHQSLPAAICCAALDAVEMAQQLADATDAERGGAPPVESAL